MDVFAQKEHKLKQAEIEDKNELKTFEANEQEKRSRIKAINAKVRFIF